MTSNLEKYKKDLKKLIESGNLLYQSLLKKWSESGDNNPVVGFTNPFDIEENIEKKQRISKQKEDLKKSFVNKKFPNFYEEYQIWYSEALTIIRYLIPIRENDFRKLYEQPKNRKEITDINYTIEDYLMRLHDNTLFLEIAIHRIEQQMVILKSAQKRFESSLFDIKQLLQSDLFDSELDAAKELNKKGFVRGAGAIAGVVLEGHLLQVCENHKTKVTKKNPTINDLNQLLKDEEIIELPMWKNIQRLADLRNLCDHKRKPEPTKEKVKELIEGVEKIIKTLF